jgi:AcrR family transcriptional regulator
LRWGYQKTTIDDIAKQAAVAKGTIYLHWKTREDLFTALMVREKFFAAEDIKRRLAEDPEGATLRGLLKHAVLALTQRPLMKAVLLRDMGVIGQLAHSRQSNIAHMQRLEDFKVYLELLREHSVVRTDIDLNTQVYMLSAIFLGYFLIAQWMPEEYQPTDEKMAEIIAETAHRTLELDRTIPAQDLQAASHALMQYINNASITAQKEFGQEVAESSSEEGELK